MVIATCFVVVATAVVIRKLLSFFMTSVSFRYAYLPSDELSCIFRAVTPDVVLVDSDDQDELEK